MVIEPPARLAVAQVAVSSEPRAPLICCAPVPRRNVFGPAAQNENRPVVPS